MARELERLTSFKSRKARAATPRRHAAPPLCASPRHGATLRLIAPRRHSAHARALDACACGIHRGSPSALAAKWWR
eukprot:5633218-Prymnesium_polylepis.1